MARSARSNSSEDVNWVYLPVGGVCWLPSRALLNTVRNMGLHKVQVSSSLPEQLLELYDVVFYIQLVCKSLVVC